MTVARNKMHEEREAPDRSESIGPASLKRAWTAMLMEDEVVPVGTMLFLRVANLRYDMRKNIVTAELPAGSPVVERVTEPATHDAMEQALSHRLGRQIRLVFVIGAAPQPSRVVVGAATPNAAVEAISVFERQIGELRAEIAHLARPSGGEPQTESNEFAELVERIESLSDAGKALVAPIYLPPTKDMAVQLVSAGALDRLEEYHSDEALYLALGSLFAGGLLGVLVNIATTPPTADSPPTAHLSSMFWVVVVLLVLAGGIFFGRARTTRARIRALKAKALNTGAERQEHQVPGGDET